MKFIALLFSAYVSGVLRHPHEGVLHVEDDEAARLFENKAAQDVTADFTSKQNKETPAESISAQAAVADEAPASTPHQSEITPTQSPEQPAPKKAKPTASKE